MSSDIRAKIEASSLGTPEAKALRATISDEKAAAIVSRSVEIERDRLRAAVDKVRALHHHNPCPIAECAGHCSECAADYDKWPCPTIRALDEALDDD